jgi:hypothetical protein
MLNLISVGITGGQGCHWLGGCAFTFKGQQSG